MIMPRIKYYETTRKNGQIMDLSDKKLVLKHKNNSDIINLGLFTVQNV